MLTGKTAATEKRAVLYGELFPDGVLTLPQVGLTPENDPTRDYHIANKKYVDKMSRRAFFFSVL